MALQVTGIIERIGGIIAIPSKDGHTFNKRELVLDLTTYDRYTGDPRPNHVQFEFTGNRCSVLEPFKVGDKVTISFVLSGANYEDKNTHEKKTFTKVVGYECSLHQQAQPLTQPQTIQPSEPSQEVVGDLPF